MKIAQSSLVAVTLLASLGGQTHAFAPHSGVASHINHNSIRSPVRIHATVEDETKSDRKTADEDDKVTSDKSMNLDDNDIKADEDVEGLPWWWDLVWKLDIMQKGEPGTDITFGDNANVIRSNIEQIYGGFPSLDRCPLAEGDITDIGDGTMFIGLQRYQQKYGSPYKLCFGPKSFLVVSDPIQAKHILRDNSSQYDKGILAGTFERSNSIETSHY